MVKAAGGWARREHADDDERQRTGCHRDADSLQAAAGECRYTVAGGSERGHACVRSAIRIGRGHRIAFLHFANDVGEDAVEADRRLPADRGVDLAEVGMRWSISSIPWP